MMEFISNVLKEWKTYIVGITLVVVAVLNTQGYVDDETFKTISVVFGSLLAMSIHSGHKRIDKSHKELHKTLKRSIQKEE